MNLVLFYIIRECLLFLWQGNCSIMKFFNNYQNSQSSLEHKNVTNAHGVETSSSLGNFLIPFLCYAIPSLSLIPNDINTAGSEFATASDNYLTCNQVELPAESSHEEIDINSGGCSIPDMPRGRQAWGYKIDEIDLSVIDELPPEIQEEFRAWLRPHKRPNVAKRGSSITHYFLPDKSR